MACIADGRERRRQTFCGGGLKRCVIGNRSAYGRARNEARNDRNDGAMLADPASLINEAMFEPQFWAARGELAAVSGGPRRDVVHRVRRRAAGCCATIGAAGSMARLSRGSVSLDRRGAGPLVRRVPPARRSGGARACRCRSRSRARYQRTGLELPLRSHHASASPDASP